VTFEPSGEADVYRSVVSLVSDDDEPIDRALQNQLIGHLFDCALDISAVLSADGVDDWAAARLHDVNDRPTWPYETSAPLPRTSR
jgi:hypothetical protein